MIDAAEILLNGNSKAVVQLRVVAASEWVVFKAGLSKNTQNWAKAQGFEAAPLSLLQIADKDGGLAEVLVGAPREDDDAFALGAISSRLPAGIFAFTEAPA